MQACRGAAARLPALRRLRHVTARELIELDARPQQVLATFGVTGMHSAYIGRLVAEDSLTERHFTQYFGELLSLKLRGRLSSPAAIEDVRQETFVRVLTTLKQRGGLDRPETLGAFVNTVCNNVLFELYRSESEPFRSTRTRRNRPTRPRSMPRRS